MFIKKLEKDLFCWYICYTDKIIVAGIVKWSRPRHYRLRFRWGTTEDLKQNIVLHGGYRQVVKTSDCGSDMHGFESHYPPHIKTPNGVFFNGIQTANFIQNLGFYVIKWVLCVWQMVRLFRAIGLCSGF